MLAFVVISSLAFAFSSLKVGLLAVLSALTFTINYAIIYAHPTGIFDHLWSLCVEEHGYLILALVAWAVRRRYWPATLALFAAGFAAMANGLVQNAWTGNWFVDVSWRTDVQVAPVFLAGAIYLVVRRLPLVQRPWLSPVCLVLGVVAKLAFSPVWITFGVGTLLLALSVATLDNATASTRRMLEPAILRQIGLWSFSLYLWQQPFYQMSASGDFAAPPMLLAALASGLASFYLIEGPARRKINSFTAKTPTTSGEASAAESRPLG